MHCVHDMHLRALTQELTQRHATKVRCRRLRYKNYPKVEIFQLYYSLMLNITTTTI